MRNLWGWICPVCDYEIPLGDYRQVELEMEAHESEHLPRSPISPHRPLYSVPDFDHDW